VGLATEFTWGYGISEDQGCCCWFAKPGATNYQSRVQKLVFTIHDEYIFKFWEPEDSNRPSLALIIAIQDQQREWTLLHSDRDAVAEADEHAVVGTGSLLAEHLIEKIWIPSLSTAVTAHLAQQLFREMKGKSTYVGGNTEIIGRRVAKDAQEFFDLPRNLHLLETCN
jgi:hypothetical protein